MSIYRIPFMIMGRDLECPDPDDDAPHERLNKTSFLIRKIAYIA